MSEMGRCMKCKSTQKMDNFKKVTMKNGRPAAKGNCHVCGTNMYKILSGHGGRSKKSSSKKSKKSVKKGSKRSKKKSSKKSKKKSSKKRSRKSRK